MKRIVTILLTAVFIAYPLLIYLGLTTLSPAVLGVVLIALLALRLSVVANLSRDKLKPLLPITLAGVLPATASLIFNSERALLLMPVFVNATLLLTFGWTLFRGPNMTSRFAALTEPIITDEISQYCRTVTVLWCIFFFINGLVSAYTVFFASKEYWTLYNGLISYILIGLLVGGEMLVRKKVKQRD